MVYAFFVIFFTIYSYIKVVIILKKVLKKSLIIVTVLITFTYTMSNYVKAEDTLIKSAKSAIAIEVETGDVLYDYNADEVREPASTTKVMTIKLIMDALRDGKIKHDQLITTSDYAASMGGSQIYLAPKEQMTVDDLLKAVIIASANDAAVALAEAVSGTEELFVQKMNEEAKRLGMKNTQYLNATGLHEEGHVTTANDLSIIARELILNYEDEIIPLTSTYEDYLRKETTKPFWLVNTNKLIKSGNGIDGLKTGWTNQAGYCLVATKKANGMRIITVVMGAPTVEGRNADTVNLLNYVFANFEKQLISPKGSIVKTEENILMNPSVYNIVLSQDIARMIEKKSEGGILTYEIRIDKDKIQDSDGKIIGKLYVYIDNKLYKTVDLELKEKVKKSNFLELLGSIFSNIL